MEYVDIYVYCPAWESLTGFMAPAEVWMTYTPTLRSTPLRKAPQIHASDGATWGCVAWPCSSRVIEAWCKGFGVLSLQGGLMLMIGL